MVFTRSLTPRRRAFLTLLLALCTTGGMVWALTYVNTDTAPAVVGKAVLIALGLGIPGVLFAILALGHTNRKRDLLLIILVGMGFSVSVSVGLEVWTRTFVAGLPIDYGQQQMIEIAGLAPIIEEFSIATATMLLLLCLNRRTGGGWVAALTAYGFGVAENIAYIAQDPKHLWATAIHRAFLGAPEHAAYSAITGVAITFALSRPQLRYRLLLPLALLGSIGEHMLNNYAAEGHISNLSQLAAMVPILTIIIVTVLALGGIRGAFNRWEAWKVIVNAKEEARVASKAQRVLAGS